MWIKRRFVCLAGWKYCPHPSSATHHGGQAAGWAYLSYREALAGAICARVRVFLRSARDKPFAPAQGKSFYSRVKLEGSVLMASRGIGSEKAGFCAAQGLAASKNEMGIGEAKVRTLENQRVRQPHRGAQLRYNSARRRFWVAINLVAKLCEPSRNLSSMLAAHLL